MREQLNSTIVDSASIQPNAEPSDSSEGDASASNRPLFSSKTARVYAFALGCTTLGAVFCGHAMAQQTRAAAQASIAAHASPASAIHQLFAPAPDAVRSFDEAISRDSSASDFLSLLNRPTDSTDSISSADTAPSSASQTGLHEPRVFVSVERRDAALPFRRVYRMSRAAGLGQTNIAQHGEDGVIERTYKVTYRDNVPVSYEFEARKVVKAPVDMLIDAGYTDRAARAMPSRSGLYTRAREIDMVATGYSPMEGSGTGRCANGMRAGYGVVAVDPRRIPLGSKLFIEGYGYALAGDTGGAIRGNRIDLGQNSYSAANAVGRRRVHVYVLNDTYAAYGR